MNDYRSSKPKLRWYQIVEFPYAEIEETTSALDDELIHLKALPNCKIYR